MAISLTKHIFGDINIDLLKLIGVFGPRSIEGEGLSDKEIKGVIENPIGTKTLNELADGCRKVVIVTDDNTRHTPLRRLLPPVLEALNRAGVPEDGIDILIGLGTHRPMTQSEIDMKFGAEISKKYRIINHAWNDPLTLASMGKCGTEFEVMLNKLVIDSDLVISLGSIVPHATTGFSGGAKTMMTGVGGEETIENTHWMALDYSMQEILGNYNNPVRKIFNDLGKKVKLRFIVNTILFDNDKIFGLVAGDAELAHKKGVEICREVYGVSIPQKADIVIAEAYPTDIDLRQAIKAICAADLVCKTGGVIILAADCPEGVAPQFPEFMKHGFKNPEKLYREVNSGVMKQKLLAYTLVVIGRIMSQKSKIILVSSGVGSEEAERLGFSWASDLQGAVNSACQLIGNNSKVIVLKEASISLPILASSIN